MAFETTHVENEKETSRPRARLRSIAERDRAARGGFLEDPELATKVVDRIDGVAEVFRSRIADPVERAATAIVLALLTLILGSAAVAIILIGLFRLVSELFSPYEWIAHALFGVVFVVVGSLVFWRRAFRRM